MHYATLHNCISLQSRRRTLTLSRDSAASPQNYSDSPRNLCVSKIRPCLHRSVPDTADYLCECICACLYCPTHMWGEGGGLLSKCKTRKMTPGSTSCHDKQVFNHVFVCFFPQKLTVQQTLNEFNFACGGLLKSKL